MVLSDNSCAIKLILSFISPDHFCTVAVTSDFPFKLISQPSDSLFSVSIELKYDGYILRIEAN